MRDIKDYLHLYIGGECMIGDLKWKPENPYGLSPGVDINYGKPIRSKITAHVVSVFSHKTTPILRPVSRMTKKEIAEWEKISLIIEDDRIRAAEEVRWCLSKGLDIFNLIPEGLAIDTKLLTTLKQ